MRKITLVAALTVVVMAFVGCGHKTPKADLKNDVDSMSYALGMANTRGLKEYLVGQLGVDTANMADFVKGLNDGVNAGDNAKKAAYYAGLMIGQQISNQMVPGINYQIFGEDSTETISVDNFMAGFVSGATGKHGLMTVEQAQGMAHAKMQTVKAKSIAKRYADNKDAGEKFIAEYAKQEGVQKLESGVLYKVLKEGKGQVPADTSIVEVEYEGKLIDGTVFDTTEGRKAPARFKTNQVIKGWTDALVHMPVGSKWEIVIPQELAYGDGDRNRKIPPFSALVFTVELKDIPTEINR